MLLETGFKTLPTINCILLVDVIQTPIILIVLVYWRIETELNLEKSENISSYKHIMAGVSKRPKYLDILKRWLFEEKISIIKKLGKIFFDEILSPYGHLRGHEKSSSKFEMGSSIFYA